MEEQFRENEERIQRAYEDLIKSLGPSCKAEELELIEKAFALAKEAHSGVTRKSGEPYILHPIAVARIVSKILPGNAEAIACALLHDVVEDTDYTIEDMKRIFNPTMANIIDGLTKIETMAAGGESKQAANFQKILLTIEDDSRTIFIKLADRLHNMRTLDAMPKDKQHKIASETTYFYAPIAERIGLYNIKTELEDLSFHYRNPEAYNEIQKKLTLNSKQLNNRISSFALPIMERLTRSGLQYSVEGRPKSIYSIWKKMQKKHITFEEVYDLLAMRIIFTPIPDIPEKTQCWFIYTIITDIYPVQRERTRDWVSTPKVNGYEALHCTLLGRHGDWIEVQIRTNRMNEIAEHGLAAHWKYKGKSAPFDSEILDNLRESISLMHSSPHRDATEFLTDIRASILAPQITVYDTAKNAYYLERGATVLDFAYAKSPYIGNRALGARVNDILTNLDHALRGGDVVEIITAQSQLPTQKWLDYVQTPLAKNCINQTLQEQARTRNENGKRRIVSIFNDLKMPFSSGLLQRELTYFGVKSLEELYAGVASGMINPDRLRHRLRRQRVRRWLTIRRRRALRRTTQMVSSVQQPFTDERRRNERKNKKGTRPEQYLHYLQSPCCSALPGDDVIGFRQNESTVIVHKTTCTESVRLLAQHADQAVDIQWPTDSRIQYTAHFYLDGIDREGLLADLFVTIADRLSVNITKVDMHSDGETFRGVITQSVRNAEEIEVIMQRVNAINGVRRVYRIDSVSSFAG